MLMILAALAAAPPQGLPVAVVHQLLDGWREGNSAKAQATWAPEFRLLTLRKDGAGRELQQDTRDHLSRSMQTLRRGAWDVRLGALSVRQDPSGIATVWAPYTFYMSGKKSHCGIETFTLYRLRQGWRIVEFADTHLWNGTEARCVDRPPMR